MKNKNKILLEIAILKGLGNGTINGINGSDLTESETLNLVKEGITEMILHIENIKTLINEN